MTTFHWFLPTTGDSDQVGAATVTAGAARHDREPTVGYLSEVARAAERAGFESALTPVGAGCLDPLVMCTAIAQHTTTLRLLVAFRAGFTLPTLLAQQAEAFQWISDGRLALNVVTGGDQAEQQAYGDFVPKDARYARTAEYIEVMRRTWAGGPFDFRGEYYHVECGGLARPLERVPPIYFGGASEAAVRVAAAHADVYLLWGEPLPAVHKRITQIRALNPGIRIGLRVHVIVRDDADRAWGEAERLLRGMDPARIRAAQERFRRMDSVGQARMTALNGGDTGTDLVVGPNLWAGIGLVREGAGTALVGSPAEVNARLAEYEAAGVDEFILSGWPHLEEAERVGDAILSGRRIPA
ncbi:LLM class flavin-dependent oxidoreductase [Dactylosporangium sp. NPDC051485]|uniref:LLM class flavin-dependent oxidoreductase n=1 Tax=Dactylosporangium sp. NPDC051485 TaxID=3154846 RepID=UPI0034468182